MGAWIFWDIHRTIGESWEFQQSVRPPFLLKHVLWHQKQCLQFIKLPLKYEVLIQNIKGKNLAQIDTFA